MKVKELREMLDELESRYELHKERFVDVEFEDVEVHVDFTHRGHAEWFTGYYEQEQFWGEPVALFLKDGYLYLDTYD